MLDRPAGLPDPHHHRRAAVGDRHRRHGPSGAGQRAGDVGPRGRGRRRRQHAAARQDRHHHLRQPPGDAVRRRRPASPTSGCATRPGSSSLADQTPEGRSIVELALAAGRRRRRPADRRDVRRVHRPDPHVRASTSPTAPGSARAPARRSPRWLGTDRLGRGRATSSTRSPASGGTPLVIAEQRRRPATARVLGVVQLKDVVKEGMTERFAELRAMGIRTVMITGDNALTARAIADEAGVDDFLAEATPEDKMAYIRKEQDGGRLVAMTGDGTNDAPGAGGRRRRRGDEQRHGRGQGGRQHGRPRLRPDEAHRHRGDRQAAADHPRRADHVLDRQRRREVLRDHPGDVRRRLPVAGRAQRHGPGHAAVGDPVGGHLQRADHRRR